MYTAYDKLKENCGAEVLDQVTQGKITQMEYMVIFLNDQIYNTSLVIEDILKKNGRYRQKEKMLIKEIRKEITKYNNRMSNTDDRFVDLIADVTASLEDDIGPHINIFTYQISQELLNHGIDGVDNMMITQTHLLHVLHRMAESSLKEIKRMYFEYTSCEYTSLAVLEMKGIARLANELSFIFQRSMINNNLVVNLYSNEMVKRSFDVFLKKVWDTKLYDKAFENWN